MRIAEHGDAIRLHRDDLVDGVAETLRRLMRQPVDQINIDALEADFAAVIEQPLCLFVWLHATNSLLNQRVKILDAHADAIESGAAQRPAMLAAGHARINFDAHFGSVGKSESLAYVAAKRFDLTGREVSRRAAAPVQLLD